jgi:hypothetical protein
MATPRRAVPRRLGEAMRRKLEVTSALAWEALVDTHVEQARQFVGLLSDHWPVEESLPRYLREMDLDETMATAIRTRVLALVEDRAGPGDAGDPAVPAPRPMPRRAGAPGSGRSSASASDDADFADSAREGASGWNLIRRSGDMVRGVMERQRRNEEADRVVQLSLARAEENVIRTHVENAISVVALLEAQLPLDRAVQQYLNAVGLHGGRAQSVFQRTMARLADVHL